MRVLLSFLSWLPDLNLTSQWLLSLPWVAAMLSVTPMVEHITLIVKKPWSTIALSGHFLWSYSESLTICSLHDLFSLSLTHLISGRRTNVPPTCFVEFSRRLCVWVLPVAGLLCVLWQNRQNSATITSWCCNRDPTSTLIEFFISDSISNVFLKLDSINYEWVFSSFPMLLVVLCVLAINSSMLNLAATVGITEKRSKCYGCETARWDAIKINTMTFNNAFCSTF